MDYFVKFMRFLAIPFSLAVIGLAVFIYSVKQTPRHNFARLDATDQAMFRSLAKTYALFQNNPKDIWSEKFNIAKIPLILVRTNKDHGYKWPYAYLINLPKSDLAALAKKVKMPGDLEIPPVYAAETLGIPSLHLWSAKNYGLIKLSNNKPYFFFKYHPGQFQEKTKGFQEFSLSLIHHLFHREIHGSSINSVVDLHIDKPKAPEIQSSNLDNVTLLHIECRLLDLALDAKTKTSIAHFMKRWLAIREERYKKWPELSKETHHESIEGTSRYVRNKMQASSGNEITWAYDKQKTQISFTKNMNEITSDPSEYARSTPMLSSYVGAALSKILDDLKPDWKTMTRTAKTEEDNHVNFTSQFEIIKSIFNLSDRDRAMLVKELKSTFEYDSIFNNFMLKMTEKS